MSEELRNLKQKLEKVKAIHRQTDSWEDFEKVVLIELRILILQKDFKNES